jgi:NAD(P)-dependent dehydrogenase (short-subunit alcohol dehydrogenase family)
MTWTPSYTHDPPLRRLDVMVLRAQSGRRALRGQDARDRRGAVFLPRVRASFWCAQASYGLKASSAVSSHHLARGHEGSGDRGLGAVKGAQRGFAKSLAREWGPHGVRVNLIGPVAMTPAMEKAYAANPALEARLVGRTPLRRIGDPEADIGAVAVFLASDMARFVTGQTIIADGGGFLGL